MSETFENVPQSQVLAFAAEYPLAWIVPVADPSAALLMPILFEAADGDPAASVVGHLPRRAEATRVLERDGRCVFLLLGPNAYIPPAWVSQDGWAPTWNFVSLKVTADQTRVDGGLTRPAVEALVNHMETRAGWGWSVAEIGARYETLLKGIIGFRASVSKVQPRFKTGQDESEAVHEEIRRGLGAHPLAGWMD